MLRAMSQITKTFPNSFLVIAGDGPDRNDIEKQIKTLGLENNINLLGMCTRQQLVQELNKASIYLSGSISEGLPKAQLEAIAMETPVVVTDVGDCKINALGVGFVVEPRNAQALAEKVIELLASPDLQKTFKQKCAEKRENFNWPYMVEIVRKTYRNLGLTL